MDRKSKLFDNFFNVGNRHPFFHGSPHSRSTNIYQAPQIKVNDSLSCFFLFAELCKQGRAALEFGYFLLKYFALSDEFNQLVLSLFKVCSIVGFRVHRQEHIQNENACQDKK